MISLEKWGIPIHTEQSQVRTQILEICESMKLPENKPLTIGMKGQLNLLLTRNQIIRIADKARIRTYNNTPFNIRKNVPYGKDNVKFYSENLCNIVQNLITESFAGIYYMNRTKLLKQKAQDFIDILQKKLGKNIKPQVQIPEFVLPDISSDMEYIFIKNINKNDSSNLHKGFMSWDIYHFIEKYVPYVMTYCEHDYIHSYNAMLDSIAKVVDNIVIRDTITKKSVSEELLKLDSTGNYFRIDTIDRYQSSIRLSDLNTGKQYVVSGSSVSSDLKAGDVIRLPRKLKPRRNNLTKR